MSGHLESVMSMEDDSGEVESTVQKSAGAERIGSLMDMDYNDEEPENPAEPEIDTSKKDLPLNAKAESEDDKDTETEKKSVEKKESKEEKEEEKKEEEKKIEAEKRKVKYKVDGVEVEEELSDEEIASAVSGRKAIQKRFTELDQQKKSFQKEQESFKGDFEYVKNEMMGVKQGFESAIKEFKENGFVKGNPVSSVYNLLDKMGLDTAEYEKAVFFHHLPEAAKFLDMDEAGRSAYLLSKENEWLRKNQDAVKGKEREAADYKAKLEQENSAKRKAGLSEESFAELKEELETKLGIEKPTLDQVVEWNKAKPFYNRAENIAQKVQGADVHKVARILLEFPETTDEWMLEQLGYKEQQEKTISKELAAKAPPKPKKQAVEDDHDPLFESFRGRGMRRS